MDIQEAILSRRSIRKYDQGDISQESIDTMLKAAMAAPSAVGKDPWFFYVVKNDQVKQDIAAILPYGKMLKDAPLAIVVCGDMAQAYLGETGEPGYMLQDCSAAIENLMLSATGLGLGSVWLGCYPETDRVNGIKTLLDMNEDIVPLAVISIGYPNEARPSRTRYDESKVFQID